MSIPENIKTKKSQTRAAYKNAAIELFSNIVWRVKTRTPALWEKGRRLNTTLRASDLFNNSLGLVSAAIDGNPVRLIASIVGGTVGIILLYSDQGVEAPAGKSVFAKWRSAVTSPNKSTMYFGMAVSVPMAALTHVSQLYYGIFAHRPEQLGQLAIGLLGDTSGLRALYKRAVDLDAEKAGAGDKISAAARKSGGIRAAMTKAARAITAPIDKLILNRHTGFLIGLGITSLQLYEGFHVAHHRPGDGSWMIMYNVVGMALLGGNKVWQEMQWDKSYQRDFFWTRGIKQVQKLSRVGAELVGRKPAEPLNARPDLVKTNKQPEKNTPE